jgi:ketosteroid isomerase-like protein
MDFSWNADQVEGIGGLAYASGPYSVSVLMGADTVSMEGKWVGIFKEQADGMWRMTLEIWNLNEPLPPGEGEHSEGEEHN